MLYVLIAAASACLGYVMSGLLASARIERGELLPTDPDVLWNVARSYQKFWKEQKALDRHKLCQPCENCGHVPVD